MTSQPPTPVSPRPLLRRRTRSGLIALAALALGCASAAQPLAMKPDLAGRFAPEPIRSVNLTVSGGQATSPAGRSKIASLDFGEALARALEESGLLYAVVDRTGDYQIDVHIEELRQPWFAWTMGVDLVTSWSVRRRGEPEPFYRDVIATDYDAPFSAEFWGIKRLRLANEGAARRNIEAAIVALREHLD